jgi:hypothetical protein
VIAYLLYRLVEKPTYDLAQRITNQPRWRTKTSWSDEPRARRRRRARRDQEQHVPEWDPERAPEPVPDAATATLALHAPTPEGNGQAPDDPVGAAESPEPT